VIFYVHEIVSTSKFWRRTDQRGSSNLTLTLRYFSFIPLNLIMDERYSVYAHNEGVA